MVPPGLYQFSVCSLLVDVAIVMWGVVHRAWAVIKGIVALFQLMLVSCATNMLTPLLINLSVIAIILSLWGFSVLVFLDTTRKKCVDFSKRAVSPHGQLDFSLCSCCWMVFRGVAWSGTWGSICELSMEVGTGVVSGVAISMRAAVLFVSFMLGGGGSGAE